MSKIGVLIALLTVFSCAAWASESITDEREADKERTVRKAVIGRCRDQMGTYGAAMVKGCVDMDMDAYRDLKKLPKKYQSIYDRCKKSMASHGWAMVKGCVDMDIEAERALQNY